MATQPSDKVKDLLAKNNLDVEQLIEKMNLAAVSLFGSGWVWLTLSGENNLEIKSCSNAGNPLTDNLTPIITIDV